MAPVESGGKDKNGGSKKKQAGSKKEQVIQIILIFN